MASNDSLIDFRIRPPRRESETDERINPAAEVAPYGQLYPLDETENVSWTELVAEMEQHSIRGVMQAEYETGEALVVNRRTAELVGRRPDLFLGGIATADPRDAGALEQLRWAHDELGLAGWIFQPGFLHVHADDPRCFPLYAYCQQRGHPVTIHTGVNFSAHGPIEYGHPLAVDRVACLFPELTIVCNHGGWPWVNELIAVLWKHTNVYADFGAIAPKYLADPIGGWGPITHWMDRQLRRKVLLGTDWPMLRYSRLLEELPLLRLREESYALYTRLNAQRITDGLWGTSK